MKKHLFRNIMFLAGFILCVYPMFAAFLNDIRQRDVVGTYESVIKEKEDQFKSEKMKAEKYNKVLYENKDRIIFNEDDNILYGKNYDDILDITGTGIMGSIEIPDINVKLPIYHGTKDESLSSGAGHMEGTSFPVGGINNHCVITGHRGLPGASLFLRLDELKKDDVFFIDSGNEKLFYRIIDISVIEPDDMDLLKIEEGKDLVSLVTCTPYGVNTHRLVVTGERTVNLEEQEENVCREHKKPSLRRVTMLVIPFMIFLTGIIIFLSERRGRGKNKKNI